MARRHRVRTAARLGLAGLAALALAIGPAGAAAAEPSCTGQTARALAGDADLRPLGATIVAPTAQVAEPNLGLGVFKPEATAPRDDCPAP